MSNLFKVAVMAMTMALAPVAFAEEAAAPAGTDAAAPAAADTAAPAQGVEMSASGDHVVKVNTGNQVVDAAGNMVARCAERSAAFKTCEAMGGFKAMGCRKLAEMRYKDVVCPL